jgi:hypothetical protein
MDFPREFEIFVDDLGGFLWAMKIGRNKTWNELGSIIGTTGSTLRRIANRQTQGPHCLTVWKIVKGLDRAGVIQHHLLERYRKFTDPGKKAA